MTSLSDQIDHLARNTRSIKATAELIAPSHVKKSGAGPYTRAVLSTELGDLIRDIDPSELALFTLQQQRQDERAVPAPELARATFTGATPLRRPPPKHEASKAKGVDPEVYAQAALKCIDRYHSVRPMPRARSRVLDIIARLKVAREEITGLNNSLEGAPALDSSTQAQVQEEEKRIQALQRKLGELQQRKQQAMKDKEAEERAAPRKKTQPPQPKVKPPPSPQEEFWNTPMASAKTLRFTESFTENLMNEQADFGDVSIASFAEASPLMSKLGKSTFADRNLSMDDPGLTTPIQKPTSVKGDLAASRSQSKPIIEDPTPPAPREPKVVQKPPPREPTPPPEPEPQRTERKESDELSADLAEPYVEKFWTTMGDQLLPGGVTAKTKKQRVKATIEGLRSVSALTPSPSSPSASTLSSTATTDATPTAQQILTAYLLLTLLTSPPDFAISMNKAKDMLSEKGAHWGSTVVAGQGTSRIIYGCVAKRLLKIERGGGEQVVKFDV